MADFGSTFLLFAVVGYFAVRNIANRTRFRSSTLKWERTVFESAAAGLVLFGIVRLLLVPLVAGHANEPWVVAIVAPALQHIHKYLPFSFSGSFVAAVVLGLGGAKVSNAWWGAKSEIRRAIQDHGGDLRVFLHEAARNGVPVSLTMKNRKVYVGLVMRAPGLQEPSYVRLLPTVSGYREERTLRLVFSTPYEHVYEDLERRQA